jgi:hypothetical protein
MGRMGPVGPVGPVEGTDGGVLAARGLDGAASDEARGQLPGLG